MTFLCDGLSEDFCKTIASLTVPAGRLLCYNFFATHDE